MEEIEDIEDNANDPFVADAIANERELALSKEQSKKFRKVSVSIQVKILFTISTKLYISQS